MHNRLALCALVVSCTVQTWAIDPPVFAEVRMSDATLDEKAWGKAVDVDGKTVRMLKGTGVVPLKAWWGADARPKKGENYKAVVRYKDTAKAPVKVELFAGLPGRYEIHRIGGTNDGAWKTAEIPMPWDMVMRIPGGDLTEIAFNVGAGDSLAVESLHVIAADPKNDEARWQAETRDWIARAQAEKRKTAKSPAPQQAVLGGSDDAVVPFVRSYCQLIHATSAPQAGETNVPLKISMATNEIEPGQFGVFANGADLKGVTISLDAAGLTSADGKKFAGTVELLTAEYAVTGKGGLFPQRLWPAYPVDIGKNNSHMFYVVLNGDKTAAVPGKYTGKIQIASENNPVEQVALEVEVSALTLLTMKESKLHMGSCVAGMIPAHEVETLVRHNQNSINLWYSGFQPKIIKKSQTDFDIDFAIADDWMKHAADAGVENFVYFLGGDPYGFPDTMSFERELYRQIAFDGKDMMAGRKEFLKKVTEAKEKLLPELRPLYVAWVKKVMAHAEEKKWPEPILTPFDEPAKWVQDQNAAKMIYYVDKATGREVVAHPKVKDFDAFKKKMEEAGNKIEDLGTGGAGRWINPHFKDSCAAMREAWPKIRIYGSIHHADSGLPFLPDINVFCTNAIHEDVKLGDKVRAGGPDKTFWQYSGGGDSAEPAMGRYAFGFFFGAFDSRGSLCWAYNFGARFDTSVQENNWIYAWTTPYSVARSPYYEGVREAWDDRRYIETLKVTAAAKGKDAEAKALLEEIFNQAVKSRTEGGRDTVNDFYARSKDPDALETMRNRIREMLLKL
jgi:hypothetical protein